MPDFSSYEYYFNLLALCLLLVPCYYLIQNVAARRALLTLAGMYLLYFIAPRLVVFYFVYWCVVYAVHRFAFREKDGKSPWTETMALALLPLLVLPLLFWKVAGESFTNAFNIFSNLPLLLASTKLWEIDLAMGVIAPLGLSFTTFRALDLVIKTGIGKIENLSFGQVMFYAFFPPVQIAGPIIEYEEVARQDAKPDPQNLIEGALRIGAGLFKAFFLAGLLAPTAQIFAAPANWPTHLLWLNLFGFTWYMYLNFAGYSDIAIGASRLFGFRLKENFSMPFFRPNIQEFWNNWHMSLSRWAQRNIFIPCGGYRKETVYRALFLTMMTIALWHDISIGMAIFGIYHFTLLLLHRKYGAALPDRGWSTRIAYMLGTYLAVSITFPLLMLHTVQIPAFYKTLAGF